MFLQMNIIQADQKLMRFEFEPEDQQILNQPKNKIIVGEVASSTRLHENFRTGKESSREAGIAYAPLEQRRLLERVFCALMYRYAATE